MRFSGDFEKSEVTEVDFSAVSTKLLELGLAGIVILVLGFVAWVFRGETKECWKERLTDWKALSEVIAAVKVAMDTFAKTSADRDRSQEAMALAVKAQADELKAMRADSSAAKDQIASMRVEAANRDRSHEMMAQAVQAQASEIAAMRGDLKVARDLVEEARRGA